MENRCVCCGEIIPEGRQVCPECEAIRYTAPNGWSGVLYYKYEYEGRKYYSLSIRDPAGRERLHSWNSCPNNLEDLKEVVDRESERIERWEKGRKA